MSESISEYISSFYPFNMEKLNTYLEKIWVDNIPRADKSD